VELAYVYWPPAQAVLENASKNRLPTACTYSNVPVLVDGVALQIDTRNFSLV